MVDDDQGSPSPGASPRFLFHVLSDERKGGAAFALTSTYAITARHCLNDSVSVGDEVTLLEMDSDQRVLAIVVHIGDVDFALLQFLDQLPDGPIAVPTRPVVLPQDFIVRYQPERYLPRLFGRIDAVDVAYESSNGELCNAHQLHLDTQLGTSAGYSGSPVQPIDKSALEGSDDSWTPRVSGLFFEELPDRVDPNRSSDVAWAIDLLSSLVATPQFQLGTILQQTDGLVAGEAGTAEERDPLPSATAKALVDLHFRGTELGIIGPMQHIALMALIAESAVDIAAIPRA